MPAPWPPPPKTETEHQVGKNFQKSTEATGVSQRLPGSRVKAWSALKTGGLGRWPCPPPSSLLPEEMYSIGKSPLIPVLPPKPQGLQAPRYAHRYTQPAPVRQVGYVLHQGNLQASHSKPGQAVRRPLRKGTFSLSLKCIVWKIKGTLAPTLKGSFMRGHLNQVLKDDRSL